jgi:glycosyltransferase involved in cell wall biosynthesis
MKKILFVINTLGHAGAEVAMLELLRQLNSEEYEVSLYVIMAQGELVYKLPKHVKLLNQHYSDGSVLSKAGHRNMRKNVIHAFFHGGNILSKVGYILSNLAVMIKHHRIWPDKLLWRILSDGAEYPKEQYDLAVAYLEGASTYYVADHVIAKKKAAFVHIDYGNAGYTRKLDKNCYLFFDQIFAVSGEVREHFLRVYPELESRMDIFHNMLNQDKIREKSKKPGGFTDHFSGRRLLTVGRLTYQKAYEVAIDAMKLLKDEGYPVRWYVLGEGPERASLEKKIGLLGLQEDFILLGAVDNPYPYYAQTDIYVHATRFEGKSIAIQEAQTLGCVIAASDCNGNKEQILHEVDGLLLELSAQGIKKAIVELLNDCEKCERFACAAEKKKVVHQEDMQKLFALLEEGL